MATNKAWALIAEIGWGDRTVDCKHIAETYFKLLGKTKMRQLERFVRDRTKDLYDAIAKYEIAHGMLEVGSDDGLSDLLYHIVGRGKVNFEICVDNPEVIQGMALAGQYTESFAYVFQEPEPPRTREQKNSTFDKLVEEIGRINTRIDGFNEQVTLLRMQSRTLSILIEAVKKDRQPA